MITFDNINSIISMTVPGFITSSLIDMLSPSKKYHELVYLLKCFVYSLICCEIVKYINYESKLCYYIWLLILASI